MFDPPPKPLKPRPPAVSGERGTRGLGSKNYVPPSIPVVHERRRGAKKGVSQFANIQPGMKHRGFLLGDGETARKCRWFYDLDGRYVRVRGRKWVVELFGPERALRALTEDERASVMRARRTASSNNREGYRDKDR